VQMRNNRRHASDGPAATKGTTRARRGGGVEGVEGPGESRGFRIMHGSISGPRDEDFAVFDSE